MSESLSQKTQLRETNLTAYVVGFVMLLYMINYFFPLQPPLLIINILFGIGLLVTLVLRYKQFLLYSLAFLVPLSFQAEIAGSSRISFPSEIICAALSVFFGIKIITGTRIDRKFLFHPVTILVIADIGWMFICSLTSQMPEVSFKRLIIKTVFYISFYYFFYSLFNLDKKNAARLFLFHCLGLAIPVAITMLKHSEIDFKTIASQLLTRPYYNDHTMYGAAIALVLPFIFISSLNKNNPKNLRLLFAALTLLFAAGLFFSYSRAAWMSMIAGTVFALVLLYRISLWKVLIAFVFTGGITLYCTDGINKLVLRNKERGHSNNLGAHFKSVSNVNNDESNRERLNRWKCAVKMFADKPVFGFGPGTYQFFYGKYQQANDVSYLSTYNGSKGHAHSEYLNYLSETGIIGMLIFCTLIALLFNRGIKCYSSLKDNNDRLFLLSVLAGLFTFFLHAFFNGFLEFDKLSMPVIMGYAIIVYFDTQLQRERNALAE